MGQVCPGYRNPTDLLFRNETTRIVQRVRTSDPTTSPASTSTARDDSPTPSPPTHQVEWTRNSDSPPTSTPFQMPTNHINTYSPAAPPAGLAHLGLNYFAANFAYIGPQSGASLVYLRYAVDELHSRSRGVTVMAPAINAVGLAALANITGNRMIMRSARSYYVTALQTTNEALRDPKRFKDDATIVSILLLGFFESMTCIGSDSFQAWARHIDGATSLLLQRGISQFETQVGQHIFQEVCSYLLTSCSRLRQPFPESILNLRKQASDHFSADEPSWMLSTLYIEIIGLFNKVDVSRTDSFLDDSWEAYLKRAMELDDALVALFHSLSETWNYTVHVDASADPDVAYKGRWHDFSDMWVGRYLNSMRSCRMFVGLTIHSLIHREWAIREPEKEINGMLYGALSASTTQNMTMMRDDMLASTALMMGYVRNGQLYSTSSLEIPSGRARGAGTDKLAMAMGCYFIFWHLYVAGSLSINPPEVRRWAAARLRVIRRIAGIQKTTILAQAIDAGITIGVHLTDERLDDVCSPEASH